MKQYALITLALVAISLLASCRDARYPIDAVPVMKIDTRLLGNWKAKDQKKHTKNDVVFDMIYSLTKQDDHQYLITVKGKDKKKDKPESTTAYLSEINKALFLNINVKDDSGGYVFLRILDVDVSAGIVKVTSIADTTMIQLASAKQVRERIAKNINNPAFYKDTTYLYKLK